MGMKLNISGIPTDGSIAVFGMEQNKETINGDQLLTYQGTAVSDNEYIYNITLDTPRIIIKAGSKSLRWRKDKERYSEPLKKFIPDLLLEYADGEFNFDISDYLEHDVVLDERPVKPLLITIHDHNSYESIEPINRLNINSDVTTDFFTPGAGKNMLFSFDKEKRHELEIFQHNLPREIMWLMYGPIPINDLRLEGVFFDYNFGPAQDIKQNVLDREPWRLEPKWNNILAEYKAKFEKLLKSWGTFSLYLTTRELSMFAPKYLIQDNSLDIKNIYGGGNPALWHYFTLPKFLKFLQSREVWFARSSVFKDPFESKTNKFTRAHQIQIVLRQIIDEYNMAVYGKELDYLKHNNTWAKELITKDDGVIGVNDFNSFSEMPHELRILAENRLDSINDSLLISCWHENYLESDAMWGLYSDRVYGIAIASTHNNIREAFSKENINLNVTPIEYHDLHATNQVFDSLPVVYKHKTFEHEKEYRVYLSGYPLTLEKKGVSIPVNINCLIERIVLSPESPIWFRDIIKKSLDETEINIEIENSIFSKKLY